MSDRARWLLWICLSELLSMLVFSNYAAVLPLLQREWALSNGEAGWIYSSYQIGYVLAVVVLTSMTDYVNPKRIFVFAALGAGVAGFLFSFFAEGFYSALLLRTLMGVAFAGTYMPGLRMVSEKFAPHERGRAVGIYVGTFSLGVALSLFVTGLVTSTWSWRAAFWITSAGPVAGCAIAGLKLGDVTWQRSTSKDPVSTAQVLTNRPALLMIGGYVAHMWEMFGMRAWMVAFLSACLLAGKHTLRDAVGTATFVTGVLMLVGAVSNALGGALSDRVGRARTVMVVLCGSSLLSFMIGWSIALPFWAVVVLSLFYGFMLVAESSVLSTGVTELAHPGSLGRTMALQSFLGWTAASLSPIAFGYVLDLTNPADALAQIGYYPVWGWAFCLLGIGGMLGPLLMWRLKKRGLA